jgi:inositol hexakisphosphate/diphosphoinositol-pentakisphosphate kinase
VNGVQLNKPFVEKPLDAENHNIHIYYPMSAGGGSKHLFRKVQDRSSEFYPSENEIRRTGSFIYEEFVITQGTDVKVYTVGPEYAHAEARKSPVVDGRVKRDSDGIEVRYPVILSPAEKVMARKIVQAFRQTVCGFDILRVHGKSYCCDVNGFSFVKNSRKYYEDASQILTEIMLNAVRPELQSSTRTPVVRRNPLPPLGNSSKIKTAATAPTIAETTAENKPIADSVDERPPSPAMSFISETEFAINSSQSGTNGNNIRRYDTEELRCVIAVIRHGDRTPKQKMKVIVSEEKYLSYFHSYAKAAKKDLKVKSKSGLLEFLKVTKEIIEQSSISYELRRKLIQIKDVLERWEISGINRKLQMKPQKWLEVEDQSLNSSQAQKTIKATELLVIVKWGGDLTPLGREQAEALGTLFRVQNYPDNENGGVLRLHATYRHDLKIKASDEGRVMKTAAAFTKGLLELEGQLTPILASLVTVEEKNRQMLDRGGNFEMKEEMDRCKKHLNLLQVNCEITDELVDVVAPGCSKSVKDAFLKLGNPLQTLQRIHCLVGELVNFIRNLSRAHDNSLSVAEGSVVNSEAICGEYQTMSIPQHISTTSESPLPMTDTISRESYSPKSPHGVDSNRELYLSETFDLMLQRWEKLYKDFFHHESQLYDLTKVPDVYDMIRYDLFHNHHLNFPKIEELFELSSKFERCVVLQEYGIDKNDKRYIGNKMCGALLEKIKYDLLMSTTQQYIDHIQSQEINLLKEDPMLYKLDDSHAEDLQINSLQRCVRTRLYFTSESHIHTILNVFHYPPLNSIFSISKEGLEILDSITNISYLSQIVIRLFEDRAEPQKYICELSFSSGTSEDPMNDTLHSITPYITISKAIPLEQLVGCLTEAIHSYHHQNAAAPESENMNLNDFSPCASPMKQPVTSCDYADPTLTPNDLSTAIEPSKSAAVVCENEQNSKVSDNGSSEHVPRRRNISCAVNMDELSNTSDQWEKDIDQKSHWHPHSLH